MRLKRILAAGFVFSLVAVMLAVSAFAHGCHGSSKHHSGAAQSRQYAVTVCPFEDCSVVGRHNHDGIIYCGYNHGTGICDGACRALCSVEDCTAAGRHLHDGVIYCGNDHEAGFCDGACYALCSVEGCTTVGQHLHNGVTYCGSCHSAGFCDGTCSVSTVHCHSGR